MWLTETGVPSKSFKAGVGVSGYDVFIALMTDNEVTRCEGSIVADMGA